MSLERGFEEGERVAGGVENGVQTVHALANAAGKAVTEGGLPPLDRTDDRLAFVEY